MLDGNTAALHRHLTQQEAPLTEEEIEHQRDEDMRHLAAEIAARALNAMIAARAAEPAYDAETLSDYVTDLISAHHVYMHDAEADPDSRDGQMGRMLIHAFDRLAKEGAS